MAKAIPNPEPQRNDSEQFGQGAWNTEDLLLEKGAGDTQSLLSSLHPVGDDALTISKLQTENAELRSIIEEYQRELEAAGGRKEQDWEERVKEYESLIDEKNEKIRALHLEIEDLKTRIRPPTPKEDELLAMSEELERERCQIQQERRQIDEEARQLKEDSEIMTEDMRKMEMGMAKERADLARQRNEVQRISEEIRHELERIERDRGLSDRLVQLRQRHTDLMRGGKSLPPTRPAAPAPTQMSIDLDAESPPPKKEDDKKKDSGMFRRFFK